VTNLQSRITEEDRVLDRHINDMLVDWNKSKPVHGSSRPKDAVALLGSFDERFKKMKEDLTNVMKAKSALEMTEATGQASGAQGQNTVKLDNAMEELQDLLGVYGTRERGCDMSRSYFTV